MWISIALSLSVVVWEPARVRSLDEAGHALAAFKVEDALVWLDKAQNEGPYDLGDHVLLIERRGIAYCYLDRKEDALAAFDRLLLLDPGHAVRYSLSPKVTFVFEEARRRAEQRTPIRIEVTWPRDVTVDRPLPIRVELFSDPAAIVRRATLYHRIKGETEWQSIDGLELSLGRSAEAVLSPRMTDHPETVELWLSATDDKGNEVSRWESRSKPREFAWAYQAPTPWYAKWWVLTLASVAAAGTSATIFMATRAPAETVAIEGKWQK